MWKTDLLKMQRKAAESRDDDVVTDVEMSFCSHCGDPFPENEPIYECRSPAGPDDEWGVTDRYCARCIMFNPKRRKPVGNPHPLDG